MRYRVGLETQRRILDATRDLLADTGLEGTTIKAICDRSGTQPGSFYNLFPSKEQAILTVVREAIAAIDPDPEHRGLDTLDTLVDAYVRFLEDQTDLARAYVRIAAAATGDSELRGRVLRHHQERVSRFAAAIRRERPDLGEGEAVRVAETLLSALKGVALHLALDPSFEARAHAQALLEALSAPRDTELE